MESTEPAALVVAAAVEADDELANAARELAWQAIALARHYLDYGSPSVRLGVIKSLMPVISKALSTRNDADQELSQLRSDLTTLHQSLLKE